MADSRPRFQQTQYAFAAAIRDPQSNPPPADVPVERMELYRELIGNNLQSFIASGFPVLYRLLDEQAWQALMRDFLARHVSSTPYFAGIPEEFLAYLHDERVAQPEDPPFLLELAHYEWVELALAVSEGETPPESPELAAEPLGCCIMLSANAWPLAYRYPVHQICRNFQPGEPPAVPTLLAVYRDRSDFVRFLEINPATYRVLQVMEAEPGLPAIDYLERIAVELGHADATPLLSYGVDLLRSLAKRGVIGLA